ncbi:MULTISPECIES: phosphotriesterase [unclassified Serratia (in: enterobacteria)]|uniref:phosphotriesterase family protein n=1 Tax=unclassified Serratia (in: enterobacteria) TaxID=2647522 RepID=UPI000505DB94|nr:MULTISPECIES: phosphotriesterase [unclassified Serratia (in: enterobacteria)]KFK97484.1 phosphotriesterase [Serratia sp. Ag2]KFK98209.1 phosphotriesterase [Serratia sp. Ag1]
MGFIRTLNGDIAANQLGVTYSHDHIYCIPPYWVERQDDDLLLDDPAASERELADFYQAGGRAIYDATAPDYGRQVVTVAEMAKRQQVHVIATTGFNKGFLWSSLRPGSTQTFADWIERSSIDALVEHVCHEVTTGIEGSDYRAGMVKCGTGYNTISSLERKTMEVIVRAQQLTGAPMHSHTEMGTMGLEQAQIFQALGLDLSRLCFAHMDRNPDPWLHRQIANTGAFLSFDGMSRIKYYPEHIRTQAILALCKRGYQKQILIGGDFARKSMSAHYGKGGLGLKFILADWRPRFIAEAQEEGLDGEALLHDFLVENPARYFAFG